jgi:HlyD family secretion protein
VSVPVIEPERRRMFILFLTLLLFVSTGGCDRERAAPYTDTAGVEPYRGDFVRVLLLSSELEAGAGTPLLVPRLKTRQVIIRWMAADGSLVEKGDRVLELDTTEVAGDLEQKKVTLEKALGERSALEARIAGNESQASFKFEKAKIALQLITIDTEVPEVYRPRREVQGNLLQKARAESALANEGESLSALQASSRADLANSDIQVEKARREIRQAEEAIRKMTLHAPEDGILVVAENRNENRKLQEGDSVWVGLQLMEIPDLRSMKVRAWLSDVDAGLLVPGGRVACTMDTYPDRPVQGAIRSISPVAKEFGWGSLRRYFDVEIDLQEVDPDLMRPGMSVRVEATVERRADVLLVRRAGVDFSEGPPEWLGPCNDLECIFLDSSEEPQRP